MGKAKRYNKTNSKLNFKKVVAAIIAILTFVMIIIIFIKLLNLDNNKTEKQVAITYYTAFENNKWGIIDSHGEVVIKPQYEEMIIVPNKEKKVFIVNYDVNYENKTYKSKAINENNEDLFKDYDKVEVIENHNSQNIIWYEEDCLRVQKDSKYGLINLSGKVLLECKYDNIYPIIGKRNSLITELNGKKGLVSSTGSVIIGNKYLDITTLTNEYEDGYIVKNENQKLGVIGTNKKNLLEEKYEEIKNLYLNNTYIVKENSEWKIINNKNNVENKITYEDVLEINNDEKLVVSKNGKLGISKYDGKEILKPQYDYLKNIYSNYYIARKDNLFGVIDENNNVKIEFKYKKLNYIKEADIILGEAEKIETDIYDRKFNLRLSGIISDINLKDGYMKIRIESDYKYYNFNFEENANRDLLKNNTLFIAKKNNKYGYVNKENIEVINYIYDDAIEQNEQGFVAVKKDGKWGAINSKGETVVEPSLELENCLIIDFIGQWHLSEDINANYYTK